MYQRDLTATPLPMDEVDRLYPIGLHLILAGSYEHQNISNNLYMAIHVPNLNIFVGEPLEIGEVSVT